jgi:serine/threonine-protein kinase
MSPRLSGPPAHLDDLWPLLRAAGLREEQLRRLRAAPEALSSVAACVDRLVQAGVLTAYQAEQVLAGRPRRLRLGPYRILDRLGAGGMGQVYKAEHVLMKRLVALKLLGRTRRQKLPVRGKVKSGSVPRRSELEMAGRLAHPHIVAAYDAARLRGRLVLVLEHVQGINLAQLVREAGPLPVALACEVVRQTALALGYLHSRGLVHRDVKPSNLLLVHDEASREKEVLPDGQPLVKLIDLGLACPAGQGGRHVCGTLDYIAPEHGIDPDAADIRSDLYSLGCTFYELLTGRVPFPGAGSWTAKLLRHRLEEADPVRLLRPEVSPTLAAVVERLMARDPDERYADPAAVVEALEQVAHVSVQENPAREEVSRAPSTARLSPRRFAAFGPWLLLATMLTGGTVGGLARLTVAPKAVSGSARSLEELPRSVVLVSGIEQPFTDLGDAVGLAPDGATLTLHGMGPFRTAPLAWRGKALTIRAAPGARSVIERIDTPGSTWDSLLASDRPLVLEGLELRGPEVGTAPIAQVEQATLHLRDCGVRGRSTGPLLTLRRGSSLVLEECRLSAGGQGLAVEVEPGRPCRVKVEKSHVEVHERTGAALLLWSPEGEVQGQARVTLTASTIHAGRIVAFRAPLGSVELEVHGNQFHFGEALLSLDGYRERDAWKRVLRWSGGDNRYEGKAWLRLEGRPVPIGSQELAGGQNGQRLAATRP